MTVRILAAMALSMIAFSAFANAGKLAAIRQQQREIREQSEVATGKYVRFEEAELARMHRAQDRIFKLLDGVDELERLAPDQRAELFNALEEVKAIIAQNEDDRQICQREHKVGTNRKVIICETMAERRRVREGGHDWKGEPSVCGFLHEGTDCGGNARSELGRSL
jgi:hypothetical protein